MEGMSCFHALAAFACKSNRLYRVYAQLHQLIFIRSGSGSEGLTGARVVSRMGAGSFGSRAPSLR